MTEQALHESPGKPLHEGVEVNPALHWRYHDSSHVRAMGYLPLIAIHGEQKYFKREKFVTGSKAGERTVLAVRD